MDHGKDFLVVGPTEEQYTLTDVREGIFYWLLADLGVVLFLLVFHIDARVAWTGVGIVLGIQVGFHIAERYVAAAVRSEP